jgi:hypothetical protein
MRVCELLLCSYSQLPIPLSAGRTERAATRSAGSLLVLPSIWLEGDTGTGVLLVGRWMRILSPWIKELFTSDASVAIDNAFLMIYADSAY